MNARATYLIRAPLPSRLALLLEKAPPGLRGPLMMSAASFRPNETLEGSFAVGEYRAAFADYWESRIGTTVPVVRLRSALDRQIPIRTAIEFNKFSLTRDAADIESYLSTLVDHLASIIKAPYRSVQSSLFSASNGHTVIEVARPVTQIGESDPDAEDNHTLPGG